MPTSATSLPSDPVSSTPESNSALPALLPKDAVARLRTLPAGDPARRELAEQALSLAIEAGDAEAALALADAMDSDPALEEQMQLRFDQLLHAQPDAIYRLVRLRLGSGIDARWLFRMRQAALAALHVAITDGDPETVLNWLTLIAREPIAYELSEILHHGILAAQSRAYEDGKLARGLVLLAAKRSPAALVPLLKDDALLAEIPGDLGAILRGEDADALELLNDQGVEVFVMAVGHAERMRRANILTPAVIDQLWQIWNAGTASTLPPHLQPDAIFDRLAGDAQWLSHAAFDRLFMLPLRDKQDTLFHRLSMQLAERGELVSRLAGVFPRAGRSPSEIIALVTALAAAGALKPPELAALYRALLEQSGWDAAAQPIIDQAARHLNQNAGFSLDDEVLWQMLNYGAQFEHEAVTRVAARCLSRVLAQQSDDALLVEGLTRLVQQTAWHKEARDAVEMWWRDFARGLSTARLNQLERSLENQRPLDPARAVVQTILSFRRMLGKRGLKQFAEDIHRTLETLESLTSAFESDGKRALNFDHLTAQLELSAHEGALSPQETQILARDLKALAQAVGLLGDRRSKATLIRREDEIERQLMLGEQLPHSALDVLKWMSGYIGGMQQDEPEP